jgi:CheY-like chemotaxis protein
MARKRALVVDDSKSARVILSRMLEKYDIEVDMAESAEQAIDYLTRHRPDAIFMDHLMPGMDGLQAVQVIKSNPQTAMIPIMMYTSQEGELYVGQARALGAMGVLPKQVRPVDVSKVLYELHLLPDRRDMAEPALLPVEIEGSVPAARVSAAPSGSAANEPVVARLDWGRRIESTLKDQALEVRRFIVASLDSFAARIVNDVRGALPSPPPLELPRAPVPELRPALPWMVACGVLCAIALLFAILWSLSRDDLAKSRAQAASLTSANEELNRARTDLLSTIKDLTAAVAAMPSAGGAVAGSAPISSDANSLASRTELVPYGELPFDRGRTDAFRDLLLKLEAQGFRGTVKVTSFAGIFCLAGNASDGFAPAPAGLAAAKCDLLGNPFEDSLTGQQRQSLAFANLVAGVRQRSAGQIAVSMENAGSTRPISAYPARNETVSAGEWNRAAAANNRVELVPEPSPAQ